MNEKIYIIIVNYNGYKDTIECLQSLKKSTYKEYEIVLVDNASTDESKNILQKYLAKVDNVSYIELDDNLGFAGGNNVGINYALNKNAKWFLLLNNDTEVEADFLSTLTDGYDGKSIRTPRINYFYDKSTPWYKAGEIDLNKCIVYNGQSETNKKVSFASGCCMLFSKEIIDRIGLMDESFFMYYEDVEYCLRATASNIDIEYISNSVIYHKVGMSSGGNKSKLSIYYNNRNRFYLIKMYKMGIRCKIYTAATRITRVFLSPFKKNNDYVIVNAYIDFKKGVKGKKQ